MTTLAGAQTVVRSAPPAVPAIVPARAAPNVTKPAHQAVHRHPTSAALVTILVREAATIHVPSSARRAVAVVAPIAALESVQLPVPTPARVRRNKAVAAVARDVQADVTTLVLQAVVADAPKRVVADAALIA